MITENLAILISGIAVLIGLISLIASWICYGKYKKQQDLLEFVAKQNEDLEESLSNTKELVENGKQKAVAQASRIAWLETRVRQPKTPKEEVIPDKIEPIKSIKSNITERRHRVLALASRGQSPETIASTLGMMAGEVELIVKFNQANAAVY